MNSKALVLFPGGQDPTTSLARALERHHRSACGLPGNECTAFAEGASA
ncbi:hypothetical protein WKW80_32185 [Variovorax humicola]|uniref:Uncharacterized protein n=1 Tax=Variovorax humicola TaxID=1769758 RepID=A0ABU8WAR1_9BURK